MRSAFAAAYLRQLAPQHAELIVGAGTHATEGRAAQDSALRVSAEFGVSLHAHAATALSSLVLRSDDVIVCMDRANEANVISRHGVDQDRVFVIGDGVISDAADRFVDDPYALGDDATRAAFHQIVAHTQRWRQILGA